MGGTRPVDLATLQRVREHAVSVAEVAKAHADALDLQIRGLQTQRAVLRAVAKRVSTPQEMQLMHQCLNTAAEEVRVEY
ncbi:hypothetical protein [Streptomyces sp. NBC_01589]|uniref:hypothetical protein n=1 Tax=unclassified Streptomyces TaxID=2593676 RepID=UPI00386B40E8